MKVRTRLNAMYVNPRPCYLKPADSLKIQVDGRMIVDAFSFFYMKPQEPQYLVPLDAFTLELRVEDDLHCLVPPPPPPPGCTVPMGIHPPNFPHPPRFYPPPPPIVPRTILCGKCQSQPARVGFPRRNLDGYGLEPQQGKNPCYMTLKQGLTHVL